MRLDVVLMAATVCGDHLILFNDRVVLGAPCLNTLEDLRRSFGGESPNMRYKCAFSE